MKRIGLIAGWGRFPIVVAESLKQQGYHVSCVALKDHADPALEPICDSYRWTGVAKIGQLNRLAPTKAQLKDIEFGWTLAKEMGRLDIGQSVVVKDRACLAVEAIEGTDECIRRAGKLCPAGGFTIVKLAKPQQDMRF